MCGWPTSGALSLLISPIDVPLPLISPARNYFTPIPGRERVEDFLIDVFTHGGNVTVGEIKIGTGRMVTVGSPRLVDPWPSSLHRQWLPGFRPPTFCRHGTLARDNAQTL